MSRQSLNILCDGDRTPVSAMAGDWHDECGHHRYYGSSAVNGGGRIVERRSGSRPQRAGLFGF
jgi:hypothetical protein